MAAQMPRAARIAAMLLVILLTFGAFEAGHTWPATNANTWLLNNQNSYQPFNSNLERESDPASANQQQQQFFNSQQNQLNSPARNLQNILRLSQHFRQGRLPTQGDLFEAQSASSQQQAFGPDLFSCVEPNVELYRSFVRQYNRTFHDNGEYGDDGDEQRKKAEMADRWDLFRSTLQRAIVFNRVVQNDVLNRTNYDNKPDIRNYHFVEPLGLVNSNSRTSDELANQQVQHHQPIMWYADITDCELGLIKHIMFDIFYLVDKNDLEFAYKLAKDNLEHLPLFNDDGFEQLADILLLRLYDRFKGDDKMNQLFQWPIYLKKLASFAYSRAQMNRPDFKTKLSLISYAYPSYFKDLKYNWAASNRTGDNIRANNEHVKFNAAHNRAFGNLAERNKRLVIFRQRWSLINQLNADGDSLGMSILNVQPDWLRVQSYYEQLEPNAKLVQDGTEETFFQPPTASQDTTKVNLLPPRRAYNLTQFSDLTDQEFVAFLSNDFSLLDNKQSADFIDRNFPVRQLDVDFKEEIALELELRRATLANLIDLDKQRDRQTAVGHQPGLQLARQVLDELISDVGLPIGPVVVENIKELEVNNVFEKLSETFRKSYSSMSASLAANRQVASNAQLSGSGGLSQASQLSETDLADERLKRYELFKSNYGRFRAWFIKEGWEPSSPASAGRQTILTDRQLVGMLRFADISWLEIKLTLFKVCCLTPENLLSLSSINSTLQYLGSNSDTLCQPISDLSLQDEYVRFNSKNEAKKTVQERQQLIAMELYYYYCVHFNKHHSSLEDFERKLLIFRRNIDSIRRHSCKRSLTLYESLRLKQTEYLNTIDVLDPRRSFTDDLNLDRFEYFRIPREGDGLDLAARRSADLIAVAPRQQSSSLGGRTGGITYRRAPFNDLLQQSKQAGPAGKQELYPSLRSPIYSLAEKLLEHNEHDLNELQRKYAHYNVGKVYELVWQRYRYCMKATRNVELYRSDFHQQCKSKTAKFADLTRNPGALGSPVGDLISFEAEPTGRLTSSSSRPKQPEGQCELYRQGLEPWAEGLIKQDHRYTYLINDAKC